MFNDSPLEIAINNDNIEMVKLLLSSNRIDVMHHVYGIDYEYEIPLIYEAVSNRNIEIIQLFLSYEKVDVNAFNISKEKGKLVSKKTALHYAVQIEDVQIVRLLLNHDKININEVDDRGFNFNLWKKPFDYAKSDEIKQLFNC